MAEQTESVMDNETTQETEQPAETVDYKAKWEEAQAALKRANRESADRRKRLDALEAAEAERKQASLSELERAQAALAEAQAKADRAEQARQAATVRAAVIAKASTRGFADTEDALRFIDTGKLEVGEDGAVSGVDAQLDALVKAKPYLLRATGQGVGATNPGRGAGPSGETDAQRRARLSGQGRDPFTTAQGGGLVFTPRK